MANEDFKDAAGRRGLTDDALLDLVQRRTLEYFTDFAHPASGMARERSNVVPGYGYDLDCVTTGGTGFGVMAMVAGAERGFLPKDEARTRIEKIVGFLEKADRFHGAFPHFLDGNTGKTIPFSPKDDGGDIVETSFLMMGLLTARQYFAGDPAAKGLCDRINDLWRGVEWDWYTKGGDNLYWHWSPNHGFAMNLPVRGWNECLVTHVLAASSPTHPVSEEAYQQGWAQGADFTAARQGPLFFSHYSFLGLDPRGLKDAHADYWAHNKAHVAANLAHCVENPGNFKGYGPDCWGLTACDSHEGYGAYSPANDRGVIAPTAALSSFPYDPISSMRALRHFYEDLGGKIWGRYGFVDSFNESRNWQAESHLAIDQGPIVVMIENGRSGLLWDLFMNCPEVKAGLVRLGFETKQAPAKAPKPPAP